MKKIYLFTLTFFVLVFCSTNAYSFVNNDSIPGVEGIGGYILTETGKPVPDVRFAENESVITASNGAYILSEMSFPNASITPYKDDDYLNGVNAFDLVLMALHILGEQPLDSPYKIIAADVNNDGNITTFDVVQLRQLLIQVVDELPNNTSWRFVHTDYEFPNITNPWSAVFPEVVIDIVISDMDTEDFVGIKIGDLNNSVFELEQPEDNLVFRTTDIALEAGQTYELDFTSDNFEEIWAFQHSINFDETVLDFVNYESHLLMSFHHQATSLNTLNVAYQNLIADNLSEDEDEILFTITFEAKKNALLSEVFDFESNFLQGLSFSNDVNQPTIKGVELIFDEAISTAVEEISVSKVKLFQNEPNPFSQTTTIGFELAQANRATLRVFDTQGKLVRQIEGDFNKGINQIELHRKDLSGKGLYYYQLQTEQFSITKKMLVL